jgi:hypothetical protein
MIRPSTSTPARPARSGITLLAILVTLCGVALAALVAIPTFFGRHDVTLDNARKLVVKDLRSAQNRAAFLETEAVFTFNEDGWVATDRDGGPLSRTQEPDQIARVLSRDGVFEGVRVAGIHFGDDDALVFDEEGLALEAGEIELWFRDELRTVRIEAGTGHVTVLDRDGRVVLDTRPAAQ